RDFRPGPHDDLLERCFVGRWPSANKNYALGSLGLGYGRKYSLCNFNDLNSLFPNCIQQQLPAFSGNKVGFDQTIFDSDIRSYRLFCQTSTFNKDTVPDMAFPNFSRELEAWIVSAFNFFDRHGAFRRVFVTFNSALKKPVKPLNLTAVHAEKKIM